MADRVQPIEHVHRWKTSGRRREGAGLAQDAVEVCSLRIPDCSHLNLVRPDLREVWRDPLGIIRA